MVGRKVLVLIAVVVLGVALLCTNSLGTTTAQEPEGVQAVEKVRYMFVQNANSGSFVPVEGKENLYVLTLKGVSPQTIAFSDRPQRVIGQVAMQKFLDGLDFSVKNPPNAAIEVLEGKEEIDVIVVELFDPVYIAATGTLQYTVSILKEPNHSYAIFNERHDKSLPPQFNFCALFIDDCKDCYMECGEKNGYDCGALRIGRCWCWKKVSCRPCYSRSHYSKECQKELGVQCSVPGINDWDDCGSPCD